MRPSVKTLLLASCLISVYGQCKFVCWDKWNPQVTRYEACTGDAVAPSIKLAGYFRQEICPTDDCTSGRVKGDWMDSPGSWAWVWPVALGPRPSPPLPCPPSSLNSTAAPCVNNCLKPGFYVSNTVSSRQTRVMCIALCSQTARVTSTVRGGGGGKLLLYLCE